MRAGPGAPMRITIPTTIPGGSRWVDLDGARIALVSGANERLLTLSREYGSRLTVSHAGTDLVGTFTNGQVPNVADVLSSLRHPAGGNGCTTAPGPAASHNCIILKGDGEMVESANSNYLYYNAAGPNVCDRHHQFMYTTLTGRVVTESVSPPGCINSVAMVVTGDYVTLPGPRRLVKPGTKFCTRVKNSATAQKWSEWACMDIKK